MELHKRKNTLNNKQLGQVIHAFGATGNATRFFCDEFEETIIDSPIPIETHNLAKILKGYSLIDQGSPVFYAHMMELVEHRGFDKLPPQELADMAKDLKRATNLPKGAQFFHKVESYLKNEIH